MLAYYILLLYYLLRSYITLIACLIDCLLIRTNEGTSLIRSHVRVIFPSFQIASRSVSLKPNISMMFRNLSYQPAILFALVLLCFAENVMAGWVRRPVMCCTSEPLSSWSWSDQTYTRLNFRSFTSLLLNFPPMKLSRYWTKVISSLKPVTSRMQKS